MKLTAKKRLLTSSLGLVISLGALAWAYDDPADTSEVGLNNLVAAYAPEGLTMEDFKKISSEIDDSWKAWTLETGEVVKEFYEGEHATVEEQRASLNAIRVKLNTMEKALKDSRYRSIQDDIAPLYSTLSAKVDLYDAVLDTLTIDPKAAKQERLSSAYSDLGNAINTLRSDMSNLKGGQSWLTWINADALSQLDANDPATIETINSAAGKLASRENYSEDVRNFLSRESFLNLEDHLTKIQTVNALDLTANAGKLRELLSDLLLTIEEQEENPSSDKEAKLRNLFNEIRSVSPDNGKRISSVMQAYFLNYNLHLYVSEGLLNRYIAETRQESSWINECIMEAYVTGYQTTNSKISVDVKPNSSQAYLELDVDGHVSSNTQGSTSQATVQISGYHVFHAQKGVTFDGEAFKTQPASVSVRANNRPVAATTNFSWMPLFGRMADNIAINEASSRTPEANAYAARQIRTQVLDNLDDEVDKNFEEATMDLQSNRYGPLREYGMFPDTMLVNSTNSEIGVHSRLMNSDEIGGSRPLPITTIPHEGLVVQVHESLLSNGAQRLDLHGKTMKESELRAYLKERFTKILGREVDIPEPEAKEGEEPSDNTLVFDEQDPIRLVVDNGQIEIRMRSGLKREGADDIPVQEISVPYEISMADNKIMMKRGNVGVKPISRPPSVAEQVARANVMRQNIQKNLGDQELDAIFKVEEQGKSITLQIISISADKGWLNISMK